MQKLPNNFSFFRNSFVENKFCAVGWNTFTMYFTTGYKFCTLHSTAVYKFCTLHYYSTFLYHIQDAAYKFSPAQTAKDFHALSHPFPISQSKINRNFKNSICEYLSTREGKNVRKGKGKEWPLTRAHVQQ